MGRNGKKGTKYDNPNAQRRETHCNYWNEIKIVKNTCKILCKLWNLNPSSVYFVKSKNAILYNDFIITLPMLMCLSMSASSYENHCLLGQFQLHLGTNANQIM